MSSALSSSSDLMMRARISGGFVDLTTLGAAAADFFGAVDLTPLFFAGSLTALAFFGAFAAPVALRVRILLQVGFSVSAIYHAGIARTNSSAQPDLPRICVELSGLR
jgi:hypothetical protein